MRYLFAQLQGKPTPSRPDTDHFRTAASGYIRNRLNFFGKTV